MWYLPENDFMCEHSDSMLAYYNAHKEQNAIRERCCVKGDYWRSNQTM